MLSRAIALSVVIAAMHTGAALSAQRLTGAQDPPPPPIGGPRTLFEQFGDRLDLNGRTQRPEAEKIFTAAAAEALPTAQQMNQLRIRLVNAEIEGNAGEATAILQEYTTVATRMAEMEAAAFAKVYAMLTSDQQKHATEAFQIIAGVFVPAAAAAAGRGGARGRGGQ